MASSIPASQIVSVVPSVLGAGGSALILNGMILTNSTRVPVGQVLSFPNATAVSQYFGPASAEYGLATVYFGGFSTSTVKPAALLFTQYNTAAVGAYLRGASVASLTLTQLQALSGTVIVTSNGTLFTSGNIVLSAATSFTNAAGIIQAAFTSPTFTVTYDSISGAFLFTSTTTGATSTITVATGTVAAALGLTAVVGAVTSQGAAPATPAAFMTATLATTQNWSSFMTTFDPDGGSGNTLKQAFANWNSAQQNNYVYVAWDTDITPTQSTTATASLASILNAAGTSGTMAIFSPAQGPTLAAFEMGSIASVNFGATNGRTTMAFRSQAGLAADVTNATAAANLTANGYNFYGQLATANQGFTFMFNGAITGLYKWVDSYIDEIWMNNQFQLSLVTLLVSNGSIPYNAAGYALIEAALNDNITSAVNFGAIRSGATLSSLQAAEVNAAAGLPIDSILSTRGWYLQVLAPTAQVRAARTTPICNFWYSDGGSVQQITLASIEIQ